MPTVYDVANLAVKAVIANISARLGPWGDGEKQQTLLAFHNECPYTGDTLLDENGQLIPDVVWDHATPINRGFCGLHLIGNLLPTTHETNMEKGGYEPYDAFIQRTRPNDAEARIQQIEAFRNGVNYYQNVEALGNIQQIIELVYRQVVALLRATIDELAPEEPPQALPPNVNGPGIAPEIGPLPAGAAPAILFQPNQDDFIAAFQDGLHNAHQVRVNIHYLLVNGEQQDRIWECRQQTIIWLNATPRLIRSNVRGQQHYRTFRENPGIQSLMLSILPLV